MHQYYLKNKEHIIEKQNDYIKNNFDKHRASCRSKAIKCGNKLKYEVFSYYCQGEPKCFCGESDLRMLTIDHINGGGRKHRREIGMGRSSSSNFYRWIRKNNYPDDFQVLCWNCNFKKKQQECKPKNPTKQQLQKANNHILLKQTCFEHYGSICLCGEKDIDVLTLDHINDDGAEHRKETGVGSNFYYYLRRNHFPNEPPLQVLCMKCQIKKNEWYEKRKI